jgi:TorA maturation chaperone TorD
MDKVSMNRARALYYGVFSVFFSFLEKNGKIEVLRENLEILKANAFSEYVGDALENILLILEHDGDEALVKESNEIFFNPYSEFIAMTASYYDEQRDDGKMRMKMLEYVLHSKFRRDQDNFKENEDHISFILEFIQKLLLQSVETKSKCSEELAKTIFKEVLNKFVDDFILSLYEHQNSYIFKEVAIIFQAFIELERTYLGVEKPKLQAHASSVKIEKKVTKPFKKRPQKNFDEIKL